jgi:predicted Zn-dependent protease
LSGGRYPRGAGDQSDVNEIGNRHRKVAHRSIASQEREIATGKQFAAEIDRSPQVIKDPVISE